MEDFWSAGVGERTASFTTVDATLSYRIGERRDMWSGLEFSLSAQNLFDRDPSLFAFTSVYVPRYDATNTSVIGRYVSLAVRSEEHTSELQSLLRISYAVFCL